MTDSTGTTTQTYDEENRVTSKTTPGFGTSTYTYDNVSNLTSGYVSMQSQDPEGNVVEKVYDKVGRLLRVNNGSDTVSYTYYDNGNMERVTYPDNAYTAYTYYSNNDLKTVQNVNSSGTTIEAYNYAYDGNRNQTTVLDGYGTTRYKTIIQCPPFDIQAVGYIKEQTKYASCRVWFDGEEKYARHCLLCSLSNYASRSGNVR